MCCLGIEERNDGQQGNGPTRSCDQLFTLSFHSLHLYADEIVLIVEQARTGVGFKTILNYCWFHLQAIENKKQNRPIDKTQHLRNENGGKCTKTLPKISQL